MQSGQKVFCVSLATGGHMIGGISEEKNGVRMELDPWKGMRLPSDQVEGGN